MHKITNFFKTNYLLIIATFLSFATRLLYFPKPREIVFDEVYFGKFVLNYFAGENFFDIHPPFGKLLIFFFAKIFGLNFLENQDSLILLSDPKNLFILRIIPLIFGILLPILIFKFTETISQSKKAAFLAALLIIFDNAFLVYSRFIFTDIILVFFGILSLWFFFLGLNINNKKQRLNLLHDRVKNCILYSILSAIALGAAISIKWTGLAIFGIIIITIFIKTLRKNLSIKNSLLAIAMFLIIPSIFYISTFAIHFSLTKKNAQDSAFFTPQYLKTLKNNHQPQDVKPLSFWGKFEEINKTMATSNWGLAASHPYGSKWYRWPFSQKPVYLWQKNLGSLSTSSLDKLETSFKINKTANIFLFGNLIIWLAAFLIIVLLILKIIISRYLTFWTIVAKSRQLVFLEKLENNIVTYKIKWLLFAYLANFLPFIFIKRVAFLYHYFFSITFAIILLAILLERIIALFPKYKKMVYLFLLLVILFFVIFSPLSYGFLEPNSLYNFQLKMLFWGFI